MESTKDLAYARRLQSLEAVWWKRWLDVQAPYRWNLRRLKLGRVLDLGCGIGRNLASLDGVGIDHNPDSIAVARERGLTAFTPDEFAASPLSRSASFDSLLLAHVVEHLAATDAEKLIADYLPNLKQEGRVVFITPQKLGYASDPTHVRFVGFSELRQLCERLDLVPEKAFSFPFPEAVGGVFKYNEYVVLAHHKYFTIGEKPVLTGL